MWLWIVRGLVIAAVLIFIVWPLLVMAFFPPHSGPNPCRNPEVVDNPDGMR